MADLTRKTSKEFTVSELKADSNALATSTVPGIVLPKDMPGTTLADDAGAGIIGEVIEHVITSGNVNMGTAAGPLTILNASNLLVLTPGDWDVTIIGQIGVEVATSPSNGGVDIRMYFKTVGGVFFDNFRTRAGIARATDPHADPQFTMHGRMSVATTTSHEIAAQMGQISTAISIIAATSLQTHTFPLVITARRVR